jgi:hypothetical protein
VNHLFAAIAVLFATCGLPGVLSAQHFGGTRPYDGIQAGYDAFQLGEERRRADIGYQLYLSDQLKYWAGIPTSRGETIYYGAGAGNFASGFYGNAVPLVPPANLEFTYAYGRFGPRGWRAAGRGWSGPQTVFEPWPYVPGDIYGYMYYSPMRQPVGQQQIQTGENRWESHPVYDPPLPNFRPLPPVDSPLLDGTPYATPTVPAEVPVEPPPVATPAPPRAESPLEPGPDLPTTPPPKPRPRREY